MDAAAAAATLDGFVRAVTDHDATRARRFGDDQQSAALLAAVVDNARALRVRDLSLRYVDEQTGIDRSGAWTADVDATWAFGGFDRRPASEELVVSLRQRGDRVTITSFGASTGRTPLWLSGPVSVRRTPDTLVLATTPQRAAAYSRLARRAIPVVSSVVTTWRPRLVVEVPAGEAGLEAAIGAEAGSYRQIAAVTTSEDGSTSPGTPVHIFVNPDQFDPLHGNGAQVVMSHEAVHVATSAVTSAPMPQWLLEGFADYVALRRVRLPLSVTAAQIAAQVRRNGVPRHLPGAAEFDPLKPHLGAQYEAAWLANVTLADRRGPAALWRFYEAVSNGRPVAEELRRWFGWTQAQLVRAWQQRLAHLPA